MNGSGRVANLLSDCVRVAESERFATEEEEVVVETLDYKARPRSRRVLACARGVGRAGLYPLMGEGGGLQTKGREGRCWQRLNHIAAQGGVGMWARDSEAEAGGGRRRAGRRTPSTRAGASRSSSSSASSPSSRRCATSTSRTTPPSEPPPLSLPFPVSPQATSSRTRLPWPQGPNLSAGP